MRWILCTVFFLSSGFFLLLYILFLCTAGWGILNITVRLLVPVILPYFVPLFWGLHFGTLCLHSLLSPLWATEKPYREEIFLLPPPLTPIQFGNWGCRFACCEVVGWDTRCQSESPVKVPEGAVLGLINICWSPCGLVRVLLTCAGLNAEMWGPVPRSGLRWAELRQNLKSC